MAQGLICKPEDEDARLLAIHRRLFLWTHVMLAFLSMLVYLNYMRLGALAFVPGAAPALAVMSMPALWPYLVSAAASWQFVSERRLGLYLFLCALLISGGLSLALAVGAFGVVTDAWSLLGVYYYQTVAHYFISWLLDVQFRSPSNNRWNGRES